MFTKLQLLFDKRAKLDLRLTNCIKLKILRNFLVGAP